MKLVVQSCYLLIIATLTTFSTQRMKNMLQHSLASFLYFVFYCSLNRMSLDLFQMIQRQSWNLMTNNTVTGSSTLTYIHLKQIAISQITGYLIYFWSIFNDTFCLFESKSEYLMDFHLRSFFNCLSMGVNICWKKKVCLAVIRL